jgi:ABC-type dipeptide/oligopeptide/nickel transport system permease subunit
VTTPIEIWPSGGGPTPQAVLPEARGSAIQARSLRRIAWRRLRRDKAAVGGGIFIIFLILVAIICPHLVQNPDTFNTNLINATFGRPNGSFGGISLAHPFGVEPVTGRDVLSRIVNGAQYSLLIAISATALSVTIGVLVGVTAGYFGGWIDSLIGRSMDTFLAFPLLVFALALVGVIPARAKFFVFVLQGNTQRVWLLIFVIGFFNWPYIGRIIRGQTLSLREREFLDAARSLGARSPYILFHELLPNLVAPILVYSTLLIPTNILFEAGLSYLGVGLYAPTPTWGGMLSDAVSNGYYSIDPMFMVIPGLAIFLTVLAFNLLGDGLRDALDPRIG